MQMEKELGIGLDVQEKGSSAKTGEGIPFRYEITNKHIILTVDGEMANQNVNITIDEDYLLTAHVSKEGTIKIKKKNKIGKIIANALNAGENLRVLL